MQSSRFLSSSNLGVGRLQGPLNQIASALSCMINKKLIWYDPGL